MAPISATSAAAAKLGVLSWKPVSLSDPVDAADEAAHTIGTTKAGVEQLHPDTEVQHRVLPAGLCIPRVALGR